MSHGFSHFWPKLPNEALSMLDLAAKTLEFKRGDIVYKEGDSPQGLYVVERGLVGLVLLGSESGREHLVRFFKPGQFFGHRALFADENYHGSTSILESTTLKMVPKSDVLAVLKRFPELYREIAVALAKELRQSELQGLMILENQILPLAAQSIIYLKELHSDHKWTRQEIANFCGSTTSTVIKALAELEKMGLIYQDGRAIEIADREGLLALGTGVNN